MPTNGRRDLIRRLKFNETPVIAELSELFCSFSIFVNFMCIRISIFLHVCKHKCMHFYLLLCFHLLVHVCMSLRQIAYNTRECMV